MSTFQFHSQPNPVTGEEMELNNELKHTPRSAPTARDTWAVLLLEGVRTENALVVKLFPMWMFAGTSSE